MPEDFSRLFMDVLGDVLGALNLAETETCASTRIQRIFKGPNQKLVPQLLQVINDLADYWPMSLRQIYYQAVANLLVPNNHNQYRRIGNICKKLREEDILPWRAMEDRARRTSDKRGLSGLQEFLEQNLESALNWRYYHRCRLQGQQNYVEVAVEKDALAPLVENAVWPLCTQMSVTKGQPSATLMEQIAGRMDRAMSLGKTPYLLHFGDLDPTGVQIPVSMKETLWRVHRMDIEVVMGGLTPKQCHEHGLPESLDAAKADDPNIERWYARFGDQAPTELDALHPQKLQALVTESVLDFYDDGLMSEQEEQEQEDRQILKRMRKFVLAQLSERFPEQIAELDLD